MKEDARKGARGARRKPRPFVCSGSCRRVRHAVWHVQKTPQRSMPVEMPCGRLRTGQARPSRKGRLFAALRRSGRDALVASGLCDVPGGTRLSRPGSAAFRAFRERRACRVRVLRRSGRSGRDALVASGFCGVPGVPGGTRLSRPGSAAIREGTRFRIDMHCFEVKSRTWSRQGHQEFRKFRSRLYFLIRFAHLQDVELLTH